MLKQVQEDLQFFIRNAQQTQAKYFDKKRRKVEFEVGQELLVKCRSFNAKGIPVFSLLD